MRQERAVGDAGKPELEVSLGYRPNPARIDLFDLAIKDFLLNREGGHRKDAVR